jgi:5-hydroxyisourate hydrolase-like protein (transthyretin family)
VQGKSQILNQKYNYFQSFLWKLLLLISKSYFFFKKIKIPMKIFRIIAVALAFISLSAVSFNFLTRNNMSENSPNVNVKPQTYDQLWKKADSLEKKGLTKSQLEVVKLIYDKAKLEKNASQLVKSVVFKLKLESYISDDDFVKEINDLSAEIKTVEFPVKPVMQSMLAEVYWRYYQQNRYRFLNRTETVNFIPADIRTWDLRKIVEQVIYNYQQSLSDIDKLKNTKLDILDPVLVKGDVSSKLRPTLYDFLAHRAVDFFMNEEPGLTAPANKFEVSNPDYILPYNKFVDVNITSDDKFSQKYYAILILQDLVKFHSKDTEPDALVDADIKRLSFIKRVGIFDNKDTLYIRSLKTLETDFLNANASTEVSYEIANYYYTEGLKYNPLQADNAKWYLKLSLEICKSAIRRFPSSTGAHNCSVLENSIKTKQVNATIEDANIPNQPIKAMINYRNVKTVYFRIIKTDFDTYSNLTRKYYSDNLINKLVAMPRIKEWSINLPVDGDYQRHASDFMIPSLDNGYYIILAGSEKNFSCKDEIVSYTSFWVSNISYTSRNDQKGSYQYTVLNRKTGAPLENVKAEVFKEKYNYTTREYDYKKIKTVYTDKDGYFETPPADDYGTCFVEMSYNGDFISTDHFYAYKYYKSYQNPHKTYFFTDRAIYRPGQIVYFKGIMLEQHGDTNNILVGQKSTVTLYDANYQKVASIDVVTNEYGTFNGLFTLPTGLLNGQMHLGDNYGNIYFSVEEYKRPKFEVKVEKPKESYKLGETVKVKGFAKAYAGSNIDGAEVKYRVVRTARFPYWWYYWWGYYPASPQMEILNGTTITDDKGEFNVSFKAQPDYSVDKKSEPVFSYTVYADVTDINGETRSANTSVSAGYKSIEVSVGIPTEIEKKYDKQIPINTYNLSGEYEHVKGSIKIYKLKQPDKAFRSRITGVPDKFYMSKDEFIKEFPCDIYSDENNPAKWEKEKLVFELNFDTKIDSLFKLSDIPSWASGNYKLEITANDKYGEDVNNFNFFTLYSESETKCPVKTFDWFAVIKSSGEPGENALYILGSSESNVSVLCEVEFNSQIKEKRWITLNNEQKRIDFPIKEEYRGNFAIHFTFVKEGRAYQHDVLVTVPYSNKEIDIEYETFRNKLLPGEKEQWKIKLKGKKGEKITAEVLASMYDASLDAFRSNYWIFDIYKHYYSQLNWSAKNLTDINTTSSYILPTWPYRYITTKRYDALNWFGFNYYYGNYYYADGYGGYDGDYQYDMLAADEVTTISGAAQKGARKMAMKKAEAKPSVPAGGKSGDINDKEVTRSEGLVNEEDMAGGEKDNRNDRDNTLLPGADAMAGIQSRKNFNETAFFYPTLMTDQNGDVVISFTMPEALTKWKFMGLAHTKDLKTAQFEKEIITQKDLMIISSPPRFFREGDKITFTSKLSNLSDTTLCGQAMLQLYDASTMKPVNAEFGNNQPMEYFEVLKGQSKQLSWELTIPEGIQAVTYKILAKADDFTDGEEMTIPILTNRMLVTETMPLPIRGKQSKEFNLDKLINSGNSTTMKNYKLTLEFTSNPAWYAVQALPYLMEYPYECAEQVFSRYYANSLASFIAKSHPRIKAVFESWKNVTPDALLSNLEKNQELKNVLLEETPWVLEAKNESQRKRNIALLFDLVRMSNELERAMTKLEKMQTYNGGFPWFTGMPDDRYITQYIATGMGHLQKLGVVDIKNDNKMWRMTKKAVKYLDNRIREDYDWLVIHYPGEMWKNHLSYIQIQYLYMRSYFYNNISIDSKNQKAFEYYKGQQEKYWLDFNYYSRGMIALSSNRFGNKVKANDIVKSLKENSINSEEMGMYWKEMNGGWYWYQAPIETQALLIECFDEVTNDQKSVEDMKVWLLKQKQTQNWKTTKATAEACYALLLKGTDMLANDPQVMISVGSYVIDVNDPGVQKEAGTGYFKTYWPGNEVKPEMGKVKVTKADEGVSWGAIYWQYFEQLDKITPAETPLKLEKKLFVERASPTGPVIELITSKTKLKVGDKIKVRIELRSDRDMEYIHLKDMRASGFEPTNVISRYKYQDGFGYYESTGDVATNFFISYLPKGTYVFEYPMMITNKGDFSNGITSIQCMYAPEFSAHSEGIRVKVE